MKTVLEDVINPEMDRQIADSPKDIPGWGMDADPENDPTYPMKHYNGADHQRFHYERAPQQPVKMEVFHSIERPNITRVFGTSTPPSGLSGAVRRFAYKYSEATSTHWMTLILADRINVMEGIVSDLAKGIVPNLWVERGWRYEWKNNKMGVIKNVAAGIGIAILAFTLLSNKDKKKTAFAK